MDLLLFKYSSSPDQYPSHTPQTLDRGSELVRLSQSLQRRAELVQQRRKEHVWSDAGHDGQAGSHCLQVPLGHAEVEERRLDNLTELLHLVISQMQTLVSPGHPAWLVSVNLVSLSVKSAAELVDDLQQ